MVPKVSHGTWVRQPEYELACRTRRKRAKWSVRACEKTPEGVRDVSLGGTMISTESVPDSGTEAATRVADVLLLFASGPAALGVSGISRRLGLSKTVVHRILR